MDITTIKVGDKVRDVYSLGCVSVVTDVRLWTVIIQCPQHGESCEDPEDLMPVGDDYRPGEPRTCGSTAEYPPA